MWMERGARQRGYIYIYTHTQLWLIHVVVQQKPTQHCKAIILQLKKIMYCKVLGKLNHRKYVSCLSIWVRQSDQWKTRAAFCTELFAATHSLWLNRQAMWGLTRGGMRMAQLQECVVRLWQYLLLEKWMMLLKRCLYIDFTFIQTISSMTCFKISKVYFKI